MPIKVTCNSCGGVLHAPDDAAGKRGRCPTCGMILTIPADAPRVAAEPSAGPAPTSASATYHLAPSNDLAFPRPPAFGAEDPAKASFGQRSPSTAATASRLPPDPRRFGDPFAKAGKAPHAATVDKVARKWARVYGGLGFVTWGVVCGILGILLPTILAILEHNGVTLPDKDPGWLDSPGFSRLDEIKAATAIFFFLLGGLFFVFGRFGVSAVPRESGAKSIAGFSALATLLAFCGLLAMLVFAVGASMNQAPPKLVPHSDVFEPSIKAQVRVERYFQHLFLGSDEATGQIQRFGMLAFFAGGLIAELWFLGSLSRLAVHLQSARAIGRVNRFTITIGTLLLILAFTWLAYDLLGRAWTNENVMSKWNDLNAAAKATARAGVPAGVALIMALVYVRSLGGIRRAIREAGAAG